MIKRLVFIYLFFIAILLSTYFFAGKIFMLSSLVACFCAIFIASVSFFSYKKRIEKKLKDRQDDEIEDEKNDENITLESEKARLKSKKIRLKNLHIGTAFVPFRLFAYLVLVICFLLLKRYEILNIAGFLVGLAAMPLGALVFGMMIKDINVK